MRLATPLLLAALLAPAVRAQTPGECDLGRAQRSLDVSDVAAALFNTGSLFYGNETSAGYIVPKLTGHSPIYAAGIWVGGTVGGQLRVAGATYQDYEFWPGPLNPDGTLPDPEDCSAYDRIWVVSAFDIADYEATGMATTDLAEWPVELGAEVVDGDGVPGNYDLAAGDRPRLYGSQTAFWVMNDVGGPHDNTHTLPIGLEVRVHAFAVAGKRQALEQATLYRYTLVNRNALPFEDAYLTFFNDPDLGDSADDYIGSDSTRGLGIIYNADNRDGNGGGMSYGENPPAAGLDFLDGTGSVMYFVNNSGSDPMSDPSTGPEIYYFMRAQWKDGTPLTEGGSGYNPGSTDTIRYAFPGDPVSGAYWSEPCPVPTCGPGNVPGDRRFITTSTAFTLQPGEARTFDLAILFGQGDDHLDSITRLRAASDLVQAAHDDGSLFEPTPPLPVLYPAPTVLGPPDGAIFVVGPDGTGAPVLSWSAVPGAPGYRVDYELVGAEPPNAGALFTDSTAVRGPEGPANEVVEVRWRVRAEELGVTGEPSESRTYLYNRFVPDFLGAERATVLNQQPPVYGIVEVANPASPVCPDVGDVGCEEYGGNTVWHDLNSTADYYVGASGGVGAHAGNYNQLKQEGFEDAGPPDDFEVRFTEAGGLAVYYFPAATSDPTRNRIAHVPFELWNVGPDAADPADDVRMVPFLRPNVAGVAVTDWKNQFTAEDPWPDDSTLGDSRITESVYFMMPDRADGYARFEQAALGFGGAGALYDPAADGDNVVDPDCANGGYYVDFCYRDVPAEQTVAPISRLAVADAAGDGTTPPVGTVVRLQTTKPLLVGEEEGPAPRPSDVAAVLHPPRPNPFAARAAVRYELAAASAVRLVVYDVLGREVAVLAEGRRGPGPHEAALDGRVLAPGVYLLVLEVADPARGAGEARAVRRLTHVR